MQNCSLFRLLLDPDHYKYFLLLLRKNSPIKQFIAPFVVTGQSRTRLKSVLLFIQIENS